MRIVVHPSARACPGRILVRPQREPGRGLGLEARGELGTHLTEEDIAKIAAAYDPDSPRMMERLARALRNEKDRETALRTDLIGSIGKELNLQPAVLDTASNIYDRVLGRSLSSGKRRYRLDVAAYAIVQAVKQYRLPVRTTQVLEAAKRSNPGRKPPSLHNIFVLQQEFPVPPAPMSLREWQAAALKKTEAETHLTRQEVFSTLERAQDLLASLPSEVTAGHTPGILAAASVYLSLPPSTPTGRPAITQKELADALGVSEYSVREFVSQVREAKGAPP